MTKRIVWIDIFKALAIIAIVIGHSGSPKHIHDFVYSFHVAAFVFISGYTFNANKGLRTILIDKAKRLLLPYFTYEFMFFALFIVLTYFGAQEVFYGNESPLKYHSHLQLIFWAPLAGMNWFLWTLFETTICSAILIKVYEKFRVNYLLLFIPIIALFLFGIKISYRYYHPNFFLFPAFDINFTTIPYFLLGFLAQQHRIFNSKRLLLYLTPALMLAMYFLAWKHNAYLPIAFRDLQNWPYAVPASLAAFGCLFSFSIIAEALGWVGKALVFIGKRTLPIMSLHLLGFRIITILSYILGISSISFVSCQIPPITEYFWIILTAMSIGFCLILVALIEKSQYMSFLLLGTSPIAGNQIKNIKKLALVAIALYICVFVYSADKGTFDYERLKVKIAMVIHGWLNH